MSKGENSSFFAKKCVISADTTVIRQMSRNARAGDRIRFLSNPIGDFAVFYFYAAYMRGFTYAALRRVFLSTTAIFVFPRRDGYRRAYGRRINEEYAAYKRIVPKI